MQDMRDADITGSGRKASRLECGLGFRRGLNRDVRNVVKHNVPVRMYKQMKENNKRPPVVE